MSKPQRLDEPCPNCEQWRWRSGETYDCANECAKRGFAPLVTYKEALRTAFDKKIREKLGDKMASKVKFDII